MVELAFWICGFFLDESFKFEKDVLLIINWIVQVVQFHLDIDPMLSWAIFSVVGIFFYNYQFSMSSGKFSIQEKLRFLSKNEKSNLSVLSGHGP